MTYRRREITRILLQGLRNLPVVVLTGMRQVGKSTLLQNEPTLRKRKLISLDDFAQLQAAKRNPEGLLKGEIPITVDEAQRAPELLAVIKQMVDRERIPGQFLLSGSASFSLLKGTSESLAGRALYLTLHPFSRREITGKLDATPFLIRFLQTLELSAQKAKAIASKDVLLGGMPTVCLGHAQDPSFWFKGFEQTYLERDVRELSQVADLLPFRTL